MKYLLEDIKYIGFIAILLMLNACREDVDLFTPISTTPIIEEILPFDGEVSRFFKEAETPLQVYDIDANANYNYIVGEKGTILVIPKDAFVSQAGNPISGMVQFHLKEIYEPKDMILENKATTTNTGIIGSGGEIFLEVTQNGDPVKLAQGKEITVKMPLKSSNTPEDGFNDAMQVFYGAENQQGNFTWTAADTSTTQVTQGAWETEEDWGYSYDFPIREFGWINCDFFWEEPNRTSLTIDVPDGYVPDNTAIFLVFKDINAVCRVIKFEEGTFISDGPYSIPIGQELIIVGIADIEGTYYGSITPITLTENHVESIVFEEITLANFATALGNL